MDNGSLFPSRDEFVSTMERRRLLGAPADGVRSKGAAWQDRQTRPAVRASPDGERAVRRAKASTLYCQEKLLRRAHSARTRNRHRWTG